jgi:hypothetical protein
MPFGIGWASDALRCRTEDGMSRAFWVVGLAAGPAAARCRRG